jgi:hypothetical protein
MRGGLRRPSRRDLCVAGTLAVSACQDVQHNPLALAVASETHGAVLFSEQLPSVPHLLADRRYGRRGLRRGGCLVGVLEARGEKMGPSFAPWSIPLPYSGSIRFSERPASASSSQGNDERLSAAGNAGPAWPPRHSTGPRSLHRPPWGSVGRAVDWGRRGSAPPGPCRSVDALWEVTPERVALDLVERADEALRRNDRSVPYSHQELTRIRRLMNGAREALGRGRLSPGDSPSLLCMPAPGSGTTLIPWSRGIALRSRDRPGSGFFLQVRGSPDSVPLRRGWEMTGRNALVAMLGLAAGLALAGPKGAVGQQIPPGDPGAGAG